MSGDQAGKMNISEKLATANQYREAGNGLYRQGKFKAAASKYHRAILYMKGIDNDLHGKPAFLQMESVNPDSENQISPELESECISANVSIYNNLAACMLQLPDSDPARIQQWAEVVIELDANNSKAWYRRGQALMRSQKWDDAKTSFEKSMECSGNTGDKNIHRFINECQSHLQEQNQKEKDMYRDMFK